MAAVAVRIVHQPAPSTAGSWTHLLADARGLLAESQRRRFRAAHAADVRIIADGEADDASDGLALVRLDSPLDLFLAARDWRLPDKLRLLAATRLVDVRLDAFRTALAGMSAALVNRRAEC